MTTTLPALLDTPLTMASKVWRHRKVVLASARVELSKRYSGSLLGMAWLVLQPTILLSIYLFVYLVIFKMRFPGFSEWDYVLYVFCGLIPYIGLSEAVNTGCMSIKQNLSLVNNIMLPMELLPVRSVIVSMVGQLAGMALLLGLVLCFGHPGVHLLWLPGLFALQVMLLLGIVWVLAALAVLMPDVAYFVNFATLFFMFISPIGFKPEMVPPHLSFMVYLNPIHYMTSLYRCAITENVPPGPASLGIYTLLCLGSFATGSWLFFRFKDCLADH